MKNRRKKRIKKDTFFDDIFKSKITLFGLFVLSIITYDLDASVLNKGSFFLTIFIIRYIVALFLIILFLYSRYKKYTDYYRRKLKDRVYVIANTFFVLFYSFWLQLYINIPINIMIKYEAEKNPIEIYYCKVAPVMVARRLPNIQYTFLDRTYRTRINRRGISDYDLKNLYLLEISVRKSLWNTYYLESCRLKRRQKTQE